MQKWIVLLCILVLGMCKNVTREELMQSLGLLIYRSSKVTLSGTAVKGIIQNGHVAAYGLNADGSCSNVPLVVGTTGGAGEYSLNFVRTGTGVCLVVSPNPNGQTAMYDEKTNRNIALTPTSQFRMMTILPEPKIAGNSRRNLMISPFSRMISERLQFLMKQNSGQSLNRLHTLASRELVIRLGLNQGLTAASKGYVSKGAILEESVPELDEILFRLDEAGNPNTAKFISILAGFSQLASQHKTGGEVSASDLDGVIEAFAQDFADGIFDGKTSEGKPITIGSGTSQITFSSDPLATVLLPSIVSYFQEGGTLSVGIASNNPPPVVSATTIASQIQFAGTVPIISEVTTATPTFSPAAGNQTSNSNITISTTTSGAAIYYTTDGTDPTTSSTQYSNPLANIWSLAGKTIKAIAVKSGLINSAILSGIFSYPPLKTGQTSCWSGGGSYIPSCTGTKQDGEFQSGVARGYTDNGDGTVTDTATGLVWQKCSNGLTGTNCNFGGAATATWANAGTYCSTLTLAGRTWRLPSGQELQTLADYSQPSSAIDGAFFPATVAGYYWSSTTYALDSNKAWFVNFTNGAVNNFNKTSTYLVRCVSGPSKGSSSSFTDNNDGTVKDNATGLIWQKCSQGQNNDSTCSGSAMYANWTAALNYCSNLNLAGRTWRLPTVNELGSLLDTTKTIQPTIDTTAFPNTVANGYWSSTTYAPGTTLAWLVNFNDGNVSNFLKANNSYVRCVSGP